MSDSDFKFKVNDKEINLRDALPIDLGFIEDARENGVDMMALGQGGQLDPWDAVGLLKMLLERCGLSKDEVRKTPLDVLTKISPAIEKLFQEVGKESASRPT